jgi:hypothetical protein
MAIAVFFLIKPKPRSIWLLKLRCSKPRSLLFFVIIKPNYSNLKSMQGIQYIIDDQGEKKAVVIDLEQ